MSAQIVIMSCVPNYTGYQDRRKIWLLLRPRAQPGWQVGVVPAVTIYTWPMVAMCMFLVHSKCETSSTVWLTLASRQLLLNLANITVHPKERMFSHLEKHFFQKRLFGMNFFLCLYHTSILSYQMVDPLVVYPGSSMLNPSLGAILTGQCHHLGKIFLHVALCFCKATVPSVSFQGVQVECKWCMCLVLFLWFGITVAFCEKGKRPLL